MLYFDYFEPVVKRELRPLAASLGWIKVEKGAAYTLSCDMRASVDGVRAVLGVRASDPSAGGWNDYSQPLKLTTAWKRYSLTFRPQHELGVRLRRARTWRRSSGSTSTSTRSSWRRATRPRPFQPRTELEFAVEPGQPAGIFVEGEPAS